MLKSVSKNANLSNLPSDGTFLDKVLEKYGEDVLINKA